MSGLRNFRLAASEVSQIGSALSRPECVLAASDGSVWTCDLRGFVHIAADGRQRLYEAAGVSASVDHDDLHGGYTPNGFAFRPEGGIVYASLGTSAFETMGMDGERVVYIDRVDEFPIICPNFVLRDSQDDFWLIDSTRNPSFWEIVGNKNALFDGMVIHVGKDGARVAARDLAFANECRLDPEEEYLYVPESFANRIRRFEVLPDRSLGPGEQFGPVFDSPVDGVAFDCEGNLWVTEPILDRITVLTPDGEPHCIADFSTEKMREDYQANLASGQLDLARAISNCSETFGFLTSLSFGGPDQRTVFVGNLRGGTIASFRSPIPGIPSIGVPVWSEDIKPLAQ